MTDRYIFPAVFYPPEQEGLDYCVVFPDLDVATQGETLQQALDMAKELLELTLYGFEDDGEQIPAASKPSDIVFDCQGAFVSLISVYMPVIRDEMAQQYVRKTVTLPKWLNDAAEDANVNFSRSLQAALRLKLNISDPPVQYKVKKNSNKE
jgi:predicted RNase H-like HicB family nuclease